MTATGVRRARSDGPRGYTAPMPRSLRLFAPKPVARKPRSVRETLPFVLDDGRCIDMLRVRDPRAKRLKLSVDERGARLTLPPRASLAAADRFLAEHRDWLAGQLDACAGDAAQPLLPGATATLPLRGDEVSLRWVRGRLHRIAREAGEATAAAPAGLVFETPLRASPAATARALRDFYETEGRRDVARWLPGYLPGLPRPPSRIVFKRMSTQWGSLAPDATLVLDLSLVLALPAAFEYVLVHELCHLIHADHSPAFWREVEARCPAWRAQRDWFQAEGRRLKARLHALLSG